MNNIGQLVDNTKSHIQLAKESRGMGVKWLTEGFTKMPNAVLSDRQLKPTTKLVYLVIKSFAYDKNHSFPGQQKIAEIVGFEGENARITVSRHIKVLKEHGYLYVEQRKNGSNIYYLTDPIRGP